MFSLALLGHARQQNAVARRGPVGPPGLSVATRSVARRGPVGPPGLNAAANQRRPQCPHWPS
eukprot:13921774-Alexandrium_andersonii.AAC.1